MGEAVLNESPIKFALVFVFLRRKRPTQAGLGNADPSNGMPLDKFQEVRIRHLHAVKFWDLRHL
jgi:hypothetical protein